MIIKSTLNEIKNWVKHTIASSQCGTPTYQGWDRKLWQRPYDEIVEYLAGRFKTTLSEDEYYLCMLYLDKSIDKNSLFVHFRDAPQYKRMLSGVFQGINIATPSERLKQMRFSVKLGVRSVELRGV